MNKKARHHAKKNHTYFLSVTRDERDLTAILSMIGCLLIITLPCCIGLSYICIKKGNCCCKYSYKKMIAQVPNNENNIELSKMIENRATYEAINFINEV